MQDRELLAVILSKTVCLHTADRVLNRVAGSLHDLAMLSPMELIHQLGLSPTDAVAIAATMEIGRRRSLVTCVPRTSVLNSETCYELFKPVLTDLCHEEFWVLLLDVAMQLIARERLSIGGLTNTIADPMLLFRLALERRAKCIVVGHNHPSGCCKPSFMDIEFTRRLLHCGQLLGIEVRDHLIVTNKGFYSFADADLVI